MKKIPFFFFALFLAGQLNAQVIKQTSFELQGDETPFTLSSWNLAGFTAPWVDGFDQGRAMVDTSFAHSGKKSLRIEYPATGVGPSVSGAQAPLQLPGKGQYYVSYWLRFSSDFSWGGSSYGGKLPGLAGGDNCSGCETCTGTNGFTARLMWRTAGKAVLYLYDMDKKNLCGDDYDLLDKNGKPIAFEKGKWYNVIERLKVNSGSNYDGEVEIWINGDQAISLSGLRFVTNGDKVDNFYFSSFHGGDGAEWAPGVDCHIWFDDIKITEDASAIFKSCASPLLGFDENLCGKEGNLTLDTKIDTEGGRTFQWYKNDKPINANAATLSISSGGIYRVLADSAGCQTEDEIIIYDQINPVLNSAYYLCVPGYAVLNPAVVGSGLNYAWYKNGVSIEGATLPMLKVTSPGSYKVLVSGGLCTTGMVSTTVTSDIPVVKDTCIPPGESISLSVIGTGSFDWYDASVGGNILAAASNTFDTPVITSPTTYYIEGNGVTTGRVGKKGIGIYTYENQEFEKKLQFDVYTNLTIDSLTVFPTSSGNVTIRVLETDLTTVVGQKTSAVQPGSDRIPLDVSLTPGTYVMDAVGTTVKLKHDQDNGGTITYPYPYTIPGVISINATVPAWILSKPWYMFFYDWKVTYSSSCTRVPLKVNVGDCPIVTSITPTLSGEKDLKVFPNPFHEHILTDGALKDNVSVKIMGISGKVVLKSVLRNASVLGVEKLKAGVYILEIVQDNELFRAKIIKK